MSIPNHTDLVFQAMASQPRRRMMDLVRQMPGCSVNELCEHFEMSRIGVMKHLQILVETKLVISKKSGRTRQLYFNPAPIQLIYDRWTDEYSAFWVTQAVDLKYEVEGRSSAKKSKAKKTNSTKGRGDSSGVRRKAAKTGTSKTVKGSGLAKKTVQAKKNRSRAKTTSARKSVSGNSNPGRR